jgi:rhodanese-related sulfurtransferase
MEDTIFGNISDAQNKNGNSHTFMEKMKSAFEKTQAPAPIKEIDVIQLNEKITSGNSNILDVRTPGEFFQGHLENSTHLSLQDLSAFGQAAESKIPYGKEDEIFVICRSGVRSAAAVNILNSLGYNALNVRGGILSWVQNGFNITN